MARFTLKIRNRQELYNDRTGEFEPEPACRHYYCRDSGGYVYQEFDDKPGTLGYQVNDRLTHYGDMIEANERTLKTRIREARMRELADRIANA